MAHPWPSTGDLRFAIDTCRTVHDLLKNGPARYDEAVRTSESMSQNFQALDDMYETEDLRKAFNCGRRVGEMGPNLRELERLSKNAPKNNWGYAFSHGKQKKIQNIALNLRDQNRDLGDYMRTNHSMAIRRIEGKVDRIEDAVCSPRASYNDGYQPSYANQGRPPPVQYGRTQEKSHRPLPQSNVSHGSRFSSQPIWDNAERDYCDSAYDSAYDSEEDEAPRATFGSDRSSRKYVNGPPDREGRRRY